MALFKSRIRLLISLLLLYGISSCTLIFIISIKKSTVSYSAHGSASSRSAERRETLQTYWAVPDLLHTTLKKIQFLNSTGEDLFHMDPPPYLPGLKNPCWYEVNDSQTPILSCLPYIMIIGQPKCGTTDIHRSILQHPDVVRPFSKEPHYWDKHRHCYCCGKKTYFLPCYKRNFPKTWSEYVHYFDNTASLITMLLSSNDTADRKRSKELITLESSPGTLSDNRWWWNYPPNVKDETGPGLTNADYVHRFLPRTKLIVSVREPAERLYSGYLFFSKAAKSAEDFHQLVEKEIEAFQTCVKNHNIRYCLYHNRLNEVVNSACGLLVTAVDTSPVAWIYFDKTQKRIAMLHNGFDAVYLSDWMRLFPREQILVLRMEDYAANKEHAMSTIFKFLGLRENVNLTYKLNVINQRKKRDRPVGVMLNKTRALLAEFYGPHKRKLADLLQDRRFLWLDSTVQ